MRKNKGIVTAITMVVVLVLFVIGGISIFRMFNNQQFFDFTYSFERVKIDLLDGTVIEGEVDSWTDFEDGDSIQVVVEGVTYLTHISNVVLISEW